MSKNYTMSVGSADEFEEDIVEILFSRRFGIIVSQEGGFGSSINVSIYSFDGAGQSKFDSLEKDEKDFVNIEDLEGALGEAKERLLNLGKKRYNTKL